MIVNVGERPHFIHFAAETTLHNVGTLCRLIAQAGNHGATEVHVHFSSTGGEVDAGFALYASTWSGVGSGGGGAMVSTAGERSGCGSRARFATHSARARAGSGPAWVPRVPGDGGA